MRRIVTRVYFADEDNTACPVLNLVPEARRGKLIARGDSAGAYTLDIRMSGEGETPFFAE